jgi:hypothetical protein
MQVVDKGGWSAPHPDESDQVFIPGRRHDVLALDFDVLPVES